MIAFDRDANLDFCSNWNQKPTTVRVVLFKWTWKKTRLEISRLNDKLNEMELRFAMKVKLRKPVELKGNNR